MNLPNIWYGSCSCGLRKSYSMCLENSNLVKLWPFKMKIWQFFGKKLLFWEFLTYNFQTQLWIFLIFVWNFFEFWLFPGNQSYCVLLLSKINCHCISYICLIFWFPAIVSCAYVCTCVHYSDISESVPRNFLELGPKLGLPDATEVAFLDFAQRSRFARNPELRYHNTIKARPRAYLPKLIITPPNP